MTTSTSVKTLSGSLHAAFAIMALAVFCASAAHAAESSQITIRGATTKTVGHDFALGAPIQETTVTVGVSYDPVTLTTNSGVALLKDGVVDAARKACATADPLIQDEGTCLREALRSAKTQIARAISQARSNTNG